MKKRRILIVGGLAAGPTAAATAVRTNSNAEVILFEESETVSYGICESSYVISNLIEDESQLMIYTPQQLQEQKGFSVKASHRVEEIVPAKHKIVVRDLQKREIVGYEYDKLILATGALPRRLNVAGEDGRNVFNLKTREDTLKIINYLKSESPKHAVIIGGGYIGIEMAEAFRLRGLDVTMIHQFSLPMEGLEQETRERVLEELLKHEVQFVTNAKVEVLQQDSSGRVKYVITNRGSFAADIVIMSLGVEPNVRLAKDAKIRLGSTIAIATDERQQTNIEDVYAAGDCCEVKNIITGKPIYLPLGAIASRTARVAGENAAGQRTVFKGVIRAIAVKVFDIEVAQVGLGSEEARQYGFNVITELVTSFSKVQMMPGSEKITLKLIIDHRTKRLIGVNIYGGSGSVLRANTLSVAIQHKLTIDDISRFDLIYSPCFAPLWDPILIAVNKARKKI